MGACHTVHSERKIPLSLDPSKRFSEPGDENSRNLNKLSKADLSAKNTEILDQVYKILSPPLGKGAFGEVRKAVHLKTGQSRAIKILKTEGMGKAERRALISEINLIKSFDHPNIVKTYEYFDAEASIYIVMELLDGEPLVDYIVKNFTSLSEKNISDIMLQLLSALNFLHMSGVVHRDIKSENLIYNGKRLTMIDFGMSKKLTDKKGLKGIEGTVLYMAPEIFNYVGNEKVDLWAAGVLMYALFAGRFPFEGRNTEEIYDNIRSLNYTTPIESIVGASPEAVDLLRQLLQPDPTFRISSGAALNHPFLKKNRGTVDQQILGGVLKNLESYTFKSKLEEAIFVYISDSFFTQRDDGQLLQVFSELDSNKDGGISIEEFKEGFVRGGKVYTDEEVEAMFNRIDADRNGIITFNEFKAASVDRQALLSQQNVEKIFKMFDKVR